MKIWLYLSLLLVSVDILHSQSRLTISRDRFCSWNEDEIPPVLYSFAPDTNTTSAVAKIMRYTALHLNFELVAANVPNAMATMEGNRRLILYNQLFMRDMATKSGTDWAALSILAHEIGHHLNQHTLGSGGARDVQELDADKFSGDILFQMGASLEESRAAMASRPETKSPNYPPKSVRLIAIGNGWIGAQERAAAPNPNRTVDTTQQSVSVREQNEAAKRQAEDEERKRQEREEQARVREEREERARVREEREERAREREEARMAASRGCYDIYGRRWCNLPQNTPLGSICYCYGVPGSGITGTP